MKKYPDHVVVAGGGRWARVLTSVLCGTLPKGSMVTVYSPHCAIAMKGWVEDNNFANQVVCLSEWPSFSLGKTHAMIVVNSVKNHFAIAKKALESGVPVLVEKPMGATFSEVRSLAFISQQVNVRISPAHVFLYASYLESYSKLISKSGSVSHINICWSDSIGELRYDEAKTFDSSLPVYVDLMPHILSILHVCVSASIVDYESINLLSGGRHVIIKLNVDGVKCEVELIRNDYARRRVVEIETDKGIFRLDFSKEPGVISSISGVSVKCVANSWGVTGRPVERMLGAFLTSVCDTGVHDNCLGMSLALQSSKLSSQINDEYEALQAEWLKCELPAKAITHQDIQYVITEILQKEGGTPFLNLGETQELIRYALSGQERLLWLDKFSKISDYGKFFSAFREEI